MDFQDVAFLPSSASISTTLIEKCGRSECLETTTCPKQWFGVSKGMLPVKYFCSTKHPFVSVKFNGDHKTDAKMRQNLATLSFGDITGFKIVCQNLTKKS